jgi:hypothetical protein
MPFVCNVAKTPSFCTYLSTALAVEMAPMNKKQNQAKPRASNANMEQRILSILQIRLDGAQAWDLCHYVSEKELAGEPPWTMDPDGKPLCERTIQRYMVEVNERISAACLTLEKNSVHLAISQRRGLYARTMEEGDHRTALAVLQDLAQLADLYPAPKKQTVHGR